MRDCDPDPGIRVFANGESRLETAVIALIAMGEFAWAQTNVSDLRAYSDYEEWRESREGFEAGLSMAGVDVKMVPVAVAPFLAWCRMTGNTPGERTLDAFASTTLSCCVSPDSAAFARVFGPELDNRASTVSADVDQWDYQL
jgi:hypothetical protein